MLIEMGDLEEGVHYINVDLGDSFSFKCQRCGDCCEDPPSIEPYEIERCSEYLNMDRQTFFEKFCITDEYAGVVKLKKIGSKCALYIPGEKGVCIINDYKPSGCVTFPMKGKAMLTGRIDDINHPERISVMICRGFGEGKPITVSKFAEEVNLSEHMERSYGLVREFIEFLGGVEECEKFIKEKVSPGSKKWRDVMNFIENKYNIRIL